MKRITALIFLALISVSICAAQEQFELSPSPRFWGVTLGARYSLEPPAVDAVETSIVGFLSAAYETVGYYRAPDGSLFYVDDAGFAADATNYNRFDSWWQLGIQQGIMPRSDLPEDLAVVFAYYRGRFSLPFPDSAAPELFFSSGLPEVDGSLLGSVNAGLAFSNVGEREITRTKSGANAEFVTGNATGCQRRGH